MKIHNKRYYFTNYLVLVFSLVILVGSVLISGCSSSEHNMAEKLTGKWLRSDGVYTIEINEILPKGELFASYYNPDPIHVGKAEWKEEEGKIQIYIELRDTNYPGSYYQLIYVEETETLFGTYYQAVAKQTFEVYFTKEK